MTRSDPSERSRHLVANRPAAFNELRAANGGPRIIAAPRLDLVAVTPAMKRELQGSRAAFAYMIGVKTLPDDWPQFPEAFAIARRGRIEMGPWTGYLFIHRGDRLLVGNGGFVAPPDVSGTVEIGYEIAPAYWNLGYATEAARAMIALAFGNGARSVIAHSLAEPNASNAVMNKVGMRFVGEITAPGSEPVWRWRVDHYP